jgi:hypothetical protein
MKDIAIYGGGNVPQEGYRTEDARFHVEPGPSGETVPGQERRIDALHRQWHDGWQMARREGWSVSPPRPMHCSDASRHGAAASARPSRLSQLSEFRQRNGVSGEPPPPIARFFARERRALGVDRGDPFAVASTTLPSEVVSQVAPRERQIKTTYTTVEVFRALSMCSAPFTHASQIADDLFTIAEYPSFTPEKREMLRNVAIMADQLAGMAANVFRMQSVCKIFGIVADLLEGKPMTPNDVLDVNMLSRSVMTLKRGRSPMYLKDTFIKGAAMRLGEKVWAGIDRKSAAAKWPDSYLSTVYGHTTNARSRARLPDIDEGQVSSLELFYSEPGDRAVKAPTVEVEVEARSGNAPLKVDALLEGAADDPPAEKRAIVPDEEDAIIQRIATGMQPVAVEWTKVQSMPVRRVRGVKAQWEVVPIAEYAVGSVDARGREEGETFVEGGKVYLCLDGLAVAVRTLFPNRWWIVDNHAAPLGDGHSVNRLPPLPLRAVVAGSADRFAIEATDWSDVAHAHDVPVGEDGYIRYWGRKFIDIGGKRVEASPRPIQGEEAIAHFAKRILDVLPATDAMQIMHLADGTHWIEGTHGYYRLRFDLALRDFYVMESGDVADGVEPRRALVDFDIDRQRWTALVGRRRSGYEDILAARYLRVEDTAESLADDEREGGETEAGASEREAGRDSPETAQSPGEAVPAGGPRPPVLSSPPDAADVDVDVAETPDDAHVIDEVREAGAPDGHEFEPTFPLYASSQTGLEREFALFGHYAEHLKRFPFFSRANLARGHRRRILLRQALRKTLMRLQDTSMVAVNRMEPAVRVELAPRVLSLRQRLVGLYPSAEEWYRLTLQQKQQQVSHMVQLAYRESADEMWPCLSGFCNEIADVVLSGLIHAKPKLRDHLMQVALYDQKGTKGTHVMLIYSDQPAHLDVFGDRASQDIHVQRLRPTFNEADFYDWLMVNRDTVLLIDAWATNKLLNLSEATSHALVSHELMPNLMEAGFDLDGRPRFHVRAVLPRRPANAVRPRREIVGVRVLHSAPATWEVLAAWAVTGTLPSDASVGALSADLSAAAESASHDAARQALLRALAAEIALGPRNRTEPQGVDRRVLVMAGRAAWALLDSPAAAAHAPAPVSAAASASVAATTGMTATTAMTAERAVSSDATQGVESIFTTVVPGTMDEPSGFAATDPSELMHASTAADVPDTDRLSAMTEVDGTTETLRGGAEATTCKATANASDPLIFRAETADARLASYSLTRVSGEERSAIRQSGSHTYVWMPGGRYYAVREIMPGRLFIVDPNDSPFGQPSLPPIPLERDGALWRVVHV